MIDNVHATGSILTSSITGLPGFDVEDVTLSNIRIDSEEAGPADWVGREIPEQSKSYPEARMFGRLPAYGLYARHVTGLRLRGIEFRAAAAEARPALLCDDVKSLDVDGFRGTPITGSQPVVKLIQTESAFLRGCVAPKDTTTFLEVHGDASRNITLAANDLSQAKKPFSTAPGVADNALKTV